MTKAKQVVRQIWKYNSWLYRHFDIVSAYMVSKGGTVVCNPCRSSD